MAHNGFHYEFYGLGSTPRVVGIDPIYDISIDQEDVIVAPAKKQTLNILHLVEEAAQGPRKLPLGKEKEEVPKSSRPRLQVSDLYNPDLYDPGEPLLRVVEEAVAYIYNAPTQGSRDRATKAAEQDPLLLQHLITCAPGKVPPASKCELCRHGSYCYDHDQAPGFYPPPSVSLCPHQRMVLTLGANDPANRNSSWTLEIKDYTGRDSDYAEEHKRCRPHLPSDRVMLLAARLTDDMYMRHMRGDERQAAIEIHALLGAWEYSKLVELEKIELKKHPKKLQAKKKRDEEITQLALHDAKKQMAADRKELERKMKKIPNDKMNSSRSSSKHYLDPRRRKSIENDSNEAEKTAAADKARLRLIDNLTAERIRDMKASGVKMTAVDELGVKMKVLKELEAKEYQTAETPNQKKRKPSEKEGEPRTSKKPRIEVTAPMPVAIESSSSKKVRFTSEEDVSMDIERSRRGSAQIPGSSYKGLLRGENVINLVDENSLTNEEQ